MKQYEHPRNTDTITATIGVTDFQSPQPKIPATEPLLKPIADKQELFRHRERARYYRTKALQAEESAASAEDLESREHFLTVAQRWRIMAERIERDVQQLATDA